MLRGDSSPQLLLPQENSHKLESCPRHLLSLSARPFFSMPANPKMFTSSTIPLFCAGCHIGPLTSRVVSDMVNRNIYS